MKIKLMKQSLLIVVFLCLTVAVSGYAQDMAEDTQAAIDSQEAVQSTSIDTKTTDQISLIKGELVNLKVYSLTRVSLSDPSIADIVSANDREILLIGKGEGQTALFLWDETGKKTVMVYVVNQNLTQIKERLETLLNAAQIFDVSLEVNPREGKVVLVGDVPEEKQEVFDKIIYPFERDLIVLTEKEKPEELVQIDLQVTELTTTLTQAVGIDWTTSGDNEVLLDYAETLPATDGSVGDFFKIGDFNRTSALLATVNALVTEGKGRILSQPKLVVVSGEEASFLVGGEVPIRTTTINDTGTAENIDYKEYGVGMVIKPTIRKNKIDVVLDTQVSEIDGSSPAGNDDVAFLTRNAQTQLFLNDGQTIVLAGMIRSTKSESVKQIPVFGKIPVLGMLFRHKSTPTANQDTEIVISLTPHILDMDEKLEETSDEEYTISRTVNETYITDVPGSDETMSSTDVMDQADSSSEEKEPAAEEGTFFDEWLKTSEQSPLNQHDNAVAAEETAGDVLADENPYDPAEQNLIAGIPPEMTSYVKSIQKKISDAIAYPGEAREYGWEGIVKLGMLILDDGTLAFALVKESSGFEVFDNNALKTAKSLAPFPKFPTGSDLMELSVTVPIVYSLHKE